MGALYDTDHGKYRKLLVQQREHRAPKNVYMHNFDQADDVDFIDGTVKQVSHIGLGCVLINADVLKKIPFRFVKGLDMHSDSFWAEDVHQKGIKIFADTSLICEHRNSDWLTEVYSKQNKA